MVIFTHVHRRHQRSRQGARFYDAVLAPLGYKHPEDSATEARATVELNQPGS